jgi:hypothetical protein
MSVSSRPHACNLSVLVKPAPDLPGRWVAHCLDLDLMAQADSLWHAVDVTLAVLSEAVADDLHAGLDPLGRRQAPHEFWMELRRVMREGEPLVFPSHLLDPSKVSSAALQLRVAVWRPENHTPPSIVPLGQMWGLSDLAASA